MLVEDALHGVFAPLELLVLVGLEVGFVVRGAEVVMNEFRFRRVVLPSVTCVRKASSEPIIAL